MHVMNRTHRLQLAATPVATSSRRVLSRGGVSVTITIAGPRALGGVGHCSGGGLVVPHHVAGAHCPAVRVAWHREATIGSGKGAGHRVVLSWPILSTRGMRHCVREGEWSMRHWDTVCITHSAAGATPLDSSPK